MIGPWIAPVIVAVPILPVAVAAVVCRRRELRLSTNPTNEEMKR